MSYRSFYSKSNRPFEQTKNTLKTELQSLQQELRELQERSVPRRQYNNNYDLDRILDNKIILIGGCILIGIGIAYFLFNPNRRRC